MALSEHSAPTFGRNSAMFGTGGAAWAASLGSTRWKNATLPASFAGATANGPRPGRAAPSGFEISTNEIPYRGVRGRALARVVPERGRELLGRLASRYLGETPTPFSRWLLSRDEPEVAVALTIERATHWDFSRRMLER